MWIRWRIRSLGAEVQPLRMSQYAMSRSRIVLSVRLKVKALGTFRSLSRRSSIIWSATS